MGSVQAVRCVWATHGDGSAWRGAVSPRGLPERSTFRAHGVGNRGVACVYSAHVTRCPRELTTELTTQRKRKMIKSSATDL